MLVPNPMFINARLMAALKVGDGELSVHDYDGNGTFEYRIDFPGGSETGTDLRCPYVENYGEPMEALLTFLGAAVESVEYAERTGRDGENTDLFLPETVEWARAWSDEIIMLASDLGAYGDDE